jgi:hypothetical protein
MSDFTHSRKMQQCSYTNPRGAPKHNAPGAAGRRLFAAAGSRRVTDGVCAICAGGVQGFIPALLLPFAGGGVPTAAAAAAPCVPALLGVLLRWAAASTAPATAPSSPCRQRMHAHVHDVLFSTYTRNSAMWRAMFSAHWLHSLHHIHHIKLHPRNIAHAGWLMEPHMRKQSAQ